MIRAKHLASTFIETFSHRITGVRVAVRLDEVRTRVVIAQRNSWARSQSAHAVSIVAQLGGCVEPI